MQKQITLFSAAAITFLTGCVTFPPALPEGYTGPISVIQDTAKRQSSSLVHMFYVRTVDGRKIKNSGLATDIANQGRGFSISPITMRHEIPAKSTQLQLSGGTAYAAPILMLTNPTCSISGIIEVNLEPNKIYRVNGSLTRESCSVWLESVDTEGIVGQRISGPGMK